MRVTTFGNYLGMYEHSRCMTSPVCPGEYSCGGQAINGISGNEQRTKTRPETRFDC